MATQASAAPPVRVEIYDQVYNLRDMAAEYILNGGNRNVNQKKALLKQLDLNAIRGARLRELEIAIEKQGRLLDEVEREEAWLYAWALTKREERRLLWSVWEKEQGYGYAGDAGAG